MGNKQQKRTLREWLSENARKEAKHYTEIAEALGRDPASVSASLSIERKQALEDNRPPYFVRVAPGLYRYNDVCEGALDEDLIVEVRDRAEEFNVATRREMRYAISELDIQAFEKLAKILLTNIRARVEELEVIRRYDDNVVMITSWRDDGGHSSVVVYARKCELDESIGRETILEIRGCLPTLRANQGVLITNGVVSKEGRDEALGYVLDDVKTVVPPVHIMDIEIMLNVLLESRTGVRVRPVEVLLLDADFFKHISKAD